jgi:hypothetical protein
MTSGYIPPQRDSTPTRSSRLCGERSLTTPASQRFQSRKQPHSSSWVGPPVGGAFAGAGTKSEVT